MTPRQTLAVVVYCPRGHEVATVAPWPAQGQSSHLIVHRSAAGRYRPGMAAYVDPSVDATGWAAVDATGASLKLTVDEFSSGTWASGPWACRRCGLWRLPASEIVDAAWAWSRARAANGGGPTRRRVVTLTAANAVL